MYVSVGILRPRRLANRGSVTGVPSTNGLPLKSTGRLPLPPFPAIEPLPCSGHGGPGQHHERKYGTEYGTSFRINGFFFWKAYLSIKQPLTAHGPIHPRVSSRHDPLINGFMAQFAIWKAVLCQHR